MTAKRSQRGTALATLNAAVEPATTEVVQLLRINGQLRLFLTVEEVAGLCGVNRKRVLEWIKEGLIDHARAALHTNFYPIPVRELAKLQDLAAPTGACDG